MGAVLLVLSLLYIRSYPLFSVLIREKIHYIQGLYTKAKNASPAELQGVQKWSKRIQTHDLRDDKHATKTGFVYLNAIFFDRHRKFFNDKLTKRLIVIVGLVIGLWLFNHYIHSFLGDELASFFPFAPVFFFVLSSASMGRVTTASVFSNCDIHMLHYPYYRTRRTILASFRARFAAIVRYNFIITTVLCAVVLLALWMIYGEMNLLYAVVFFAFLTTTGLFFAFTDLFLYYIIQPYDSEGRNKSAVFQIVNFVIGILVWMQINLRLEFIPYAAVIVSATVAYVLVGTGLLLRFAPKNFKLR